MAGHSQFKNIMHKKGKQDAVRSKVFSKLAREITVAAKLGMPDPAMNPRLRAAVLAARAENMPKDNIERAIKKASGGEGENYDEVRYEGYAPGGVAVIVEALAGPAAGRERAVPDRHGDGDALARPGLRRPGRPDRRLRRPWPCPPPRPPAGRGPRRRGAAPPVGAPG